MNQIASLRAEIAALQSEHTALSLPQRTRAEVAVAVRAMIDHWKRVGDANIDLAAAQAARGMAPTALRVRVSPGGTVDMGPLLCSVLGAAAVSERLMLAVNALPDRLEGTDRTDRMTAISAELDRLETEEERLVSEQWEAGNRIDRRPDVRPEIVLSVRLVS